MRMFNLVNLATLIWGVQSYLLGCRSDDARRICVSFVLKLYVDRSACLFNCSIIFASCSHLWYDPPPSLSEKKQILFLTCMIFFLSMAPPFTTLPSLCSFVFKIPLGKVNPRPQELLLCILMPYLLILPLPPPLPSLYTAFVVVKLSKVFLMNL